MSSSLHFIRSSEDEQSTCSCILGYNNKGDNPAAAKIRDTTHVQRTLKVENKIIESDLKTSTRILFITQSRFWMESTSTKIEPTTLPVACAVKGKNMDTNSQVDATGESTYPTLPISSTDSNEGGTTSKGNKSRKCSKSKRTTRHSLSVPSLPRSITAAASMEFLHTFPTNSSCSSSTQRAHSHQQQSTDVSGSPTLKVLQALAKFQTCLIILSNAVVSLHDSLKLILPGHSSASLPSLPSSKMPAAIERTFDNQVFSHSEISLDNNNCLKEDADDTLASPAPNNTKQRNRESVIVGLSNPSSISSSCFDTDSSDFSFSEGHCGDQHDTDHHSRSTKEQQQHPRFRNFVSKLVKYVGLFLALFASVCMSLVTLVVKFMEGYNPVSKVIWRLQGVFLPSLLILIYVKYYKKKPLISWKGQDVPTKHWKWKLLGLLVIRGVVGCSADIFQYYSLNYLPLADSTVISFSTPIFVCIVAHYVLGERWGIVPILTAVVTLCGVIVIAKPPILTGEEGMNNSKLLGDCLAVLCMISATFTTIIMRFLKHVHFAMTMLALGVVGTLEGIFLSLITSPLELPRWHNTQDVALAGLTVGLFFFGQLAQTLALKYEEAGVVSLVRTCDVLFAFIWQVNLLNQEANMYSCIGAAIVTSGVCVTALRRWVSDMPEHHPIRNKLFFLLR